MGVISSEQGMINSILGNSIINYSKSINNFSKLKVYDLLREGSSYILFLDDMSSVNGVLVYHTDYYANGKPRNLVVTALDVNVLLPLEMQTNIVSDMIKYYCITTSKELPTVTYKSIIGINNIDVKSTFRNLHKLYKDSQSQNSKVRLTISGR